MGTASTLSRAQIYNEIERTLGLVPSWVKQVPEPALAGLWISMRDFYLAETKVPNKYKELIGLAVAGATRCRYCALFHTEAAKIAGATDEEIAEASMMGGLSMMASTFINAQQIDYDAFKKETLELVKHAKKEQAKLTRATQPPRVHS